MHDQLRQTIAKHLADVQTRNPNFSLRSMAKLIGINHSALSELINGKRRVSARKAAEIATRLGLQSDEVRKISTEAAAQGQRKITVAKKSSRTPTALDLDQFETISGWLPFGLLSLMETESYEPDMTWMAKRMGVPKRTIVSTLKRLLRLGMVALDGNGHYRATGASFATPEFIASEAMKLHHLQNLDLARHALDHLPVALRYFSSMTMAIDPNRLPEAKRVLQAFRDEFCQDLEAPPKREVYRLVLQLFPVSKIEGTKGSASAH